MRSLKLLPGAPSIALVKSSTLPQPLVKPSSKLEELQAENHQLETENADLRLLAEERHQKLILLRAEIASVRAALFE